MKASDIFVKALENEGVEYIFGIPGEENLDMLNSLKDSSIKLILTRHEQGAGFMAATYGRLTGRVGVCMSTLGPGAANLVNPSMYATLGGMPICMLTAQKPIKSSKQARFQVVDLVELMKPISKYSKEVVDARKITSMVRESFKISSEEKPGAVHIELPEDVAREEAELNLFDVIVPKYPVASAETINETLAMIYQAKHPLILVAAGANRQHISEPLQNLINKSDIPFFMTQMGKGVVNESHPHCLGTASLSANDFIHCAIDKADLIINVGHDDVEKPPFIMEKGGKKVIHINYYSSNVDDTYFPQLDVLGDIGANLTAINEHLVKQDNWDFTYFLEAKTQADKHITKYFNDTRFPILPQRAIKQIREHMGNEDIVTLDNGVYKIWFSRNYRCYAPNTLLLDNALATMGAGLASAMAAKMVHPDKKVISVSGDGGFMMNSQELETAVRLNLDLVVIVLNDGSYGMIKWKQAGMGFDDFGLDYNNPDFVKYAESFGAYGHRPTSCEDFDAILDKSLNSKGVHLIDLSIDYSLNHSILNELLKNKTCS